MNIKWIFYDSLMKSNAIDKPFKWNKLIYTQQVFPILLSHFIQLKQALKLETESDIYILINFYSMFFFPSYHWF